MTTAPSYTSSLSSWKRARVGEETPSTVPSTVPSSDFCNPGLALVREEVQIDGKTVHLAMLRDALTWRERKEVRNGEVGDWQKDDDAFLASFVLPGAANKFDILQTLNPFPRDGRIEFFEEGHKYVIDGATCVPRSVTGLVHQFEVPFDADGTIGKMRKGSNWNLKKKDYTKPNGEIMTDAEIKDKWDKNRDVSSRRGTLMHWQIEMFLNGAKIFGPFSTEFGYFLNFYQKFMLEKGLEAVRTEFSVFHSGLVCAGQIDLLARYAGTKSYVILDWKRSKEIRTSNRFQRLKAPLRHLDQTNLETYSLQLNMYRYILQTEYDVAVEEMYLVVLHENNEAPFVKSVRTMDDEIDLIVKYEQETRHAGNPTSGAAAPFVVEHLVNLPPAARTEGGGDEE